MSEFKVEKTSSDGTVNFINNKTGKYRIVLVDYLTKITMYQIEGLYDKGYRGYITPGPAGGYSGKTIFKVYDENDNLDMEHVYEYNGKSRQIVVNGKPIYIKSSKYDTPWHIVEEVFWKLVYERDFVKVEVGDVVVDVGANIGIFSIFAQNMKPKHIYAIEPMKETVKYLKENLKDFSNVTIFEKAISVDGKDATFIDCGNTGVNISKDKLNTIENVDGLAALGWKDRFIERTVESININDFIKQNEIKVIDFLKVDCEGGELDLFTSIDKNYLTNNVRKIALEYHSSKIKNIILDIFKECGLVIEDTWGRRDDGNIYAYNPRLIVKDPK